MTREAFTTKAFRSDSLATVGRANAIISEYQAQGFQLTLRQLYYQFVARGYIENTIRSYKRLGALISDARLAGLVDWDAIEDRTRALTRWQHRGSPADAIRAARDAYAIDLWSNQPFRPEVWIEKEALAGVVSGVCARNDVPYFSCRGYVSQSEQYAAGQRHAEWARGDQRPVVIHLGDHDPSGIDMTRDNDARLGVFSYRATFVRRIALNLDQIEELSPPPNPAKKADRRYRAYVEMFGITDSWELDALDPALLSSLIDEAIAEYRDDDLWAERLEQQQSDLDRLDAIVRVAT